MMRSTPASSAQPACNRPRRGMTLLETTMAFSLAAMLLTPVLGLLHTSRQVWEVTDSDSSRLYTLHATLREVSEQLRTAQAVTAVENRPRRAAQLSFLNANRQVCGWLHDTTQQKIFFSRAAAADLLATGIVDLSFETFTAAGTPTNRGPDIRQVRCQATVRLQGNNNELRTAECWTWLRGS